MPRNVYPLRPLDVTLMTSLFAFAQTKLSLLQATTSVSENKVERKEASAASRPALMTVGDHGCGVVCSLQ